MTNYLNLAQIIISALLVVCILLQSRGSGLSSFLGGSGEFYQTRRGLEKKLFWFTLILAILFLVLGVIRLIL